MPSASVRIVAEKLLNTQCSKEVEAGVIRFPESFRVKFVTFVCCHDMTGRPGLCTTPAPQAQYCPAVIVTHGTRVQEVTPNAVTTDHHHVSSGYQETSVTLPWSRARSGRTPGSTSTATRRPRWGLSELEEETEYFTTRIYNLEESSVVISTSINSYKYSS